MLSLPSKLNIYMNDISHHKSTNKQHKNKQTSSSSSHTHNDLVVEVERTTMSLSLTDQLGECNWAMCCAVVLRLFFNLMCINRVIRYQKSLACLANFLILTFVITSFDMQ